MSDKIKLSNASPCNVSSHILLERRHICSDCTEIVLSVFTVCFQMGHNAMASMGKKWKLMTYNISGGMSDKIKYVSHVRRQCWMIVDVYVRPFPFELPALFVLYIFVFCILYFVFEVYMKQFPFELPAFFILHPPHHTHLKCQQNNLVNNFSL